MTVDRIKSLYRRTLTELVYVRRYAGAGTNRPHFDYPCHAQVVGYQPHELIGSIVQGDRKAIVFAQDLIDAQFPLPVTVSDKLIVRGKELAIIAPDDSTRRVGGELVALELQVRG